MKQVTSVIKLILSPDENTAACLDDQSRKCNSAFNMLLEKANQLKQEVRTHQLGWWLRRL